MQVKKAYYKLQSYKCRLFKPISNTDANKFFVYPLDVKDQEHYILFDIIERTSESGSQRLVSNRQITKREDNLNQVVYGANRFFSEGTTSGIMNIPTGKGAART